MFGRLGILTRRALTGALPAKSPEIVGEFLPVAMHCLE
jgi:hypothetical protein